MILPMPIDAVAALSQVSLFADVDPRDLERLARTFKERTFREGHEITTEGAAGVGFFVIVEGSATVTVGGVQKAALGPGDSFGEMALLAEEPQRSATVTALEDAETFAVHRAEFERLRSRHPDVDRILLRFLAGELRRVNERMLEALYVSAEKRTLRRLVELAELYRSAGGEIEITLTQESIAELAGVARPTVNHVLREEEKRGTVALERGRTRVVDLDELARRAR